MDEDKEIKPFVVINEPSFYMEIRVNDETTRNFLETWVASKKTITGSLLSSDFATIPQQVPSGEMPADAVDHLQQMHAKVLSKQENTSDGVRKDFHDSRLRDASGRKHCSSCDDWFPESEFYPKKTTRDGLGSSCKKCCKYQKVKHKAQIRKEQLKALNKEGFTIKEETEKRDPEAVTKASETVSTSEKHCPDCKTNKPVDEFGKNNNNKDGRQTYCKLCAAKRSKASHDKKAKQDAGEPVDNHLSKKMLQQSAGGDWDTPELDILQENFFKLGGEEGGALKIYEQRLLPNRSLEEITNMAKHLGMML